MSAGRPTKYKKEYNDQVFKLCLLGATDIEISEFFEIDETTLHRWKAKEPLFRQSLKRGKMEADMEVSNSLYNMATGYKYEEQQSTAKGTVVTVEKYQHPNERSNARWLHNRRNNWRENAMPEDRVLEIKFVNNK